MELKTIIQENRSDGIIIFKSNVELKNAKKLEIRRKNLPDFVF